VIGINILYVLGVAFGFSLFMNIFQYVRYKPSKKYCASAYCRSIQDPRCGGGNCSHHCHMNCSGKCKPSTYDFGGHEFIEFPTDNRSMNLKCKKCCLSISSINDLKNAKSCRTELELMKTQEILES
jgi:hypothetical protein